MKTEFKIAGTQFASPERVSEDLLKRQSDTITSMHILCELLDSMPDFVMILNNCRQIIYGNKVLLDFSAKQGCEIFVGLRPGELLSCQHALSAESGCGTGEACQTCGAVLTILDAIGGMYSNRECRIIRILSDGMSSIDLRVWGRQFMHENKNYCLIMASDISNEKRRHVLEKIFFHDVLNTAGSIMGIADLLNDGLLSLEEIKDDLRNSSRQLIDEIKCQRQLLAAENNELTVSMESIDSLKFLEEIVSSFKNNNAASDRIIAVSQASEGFMFKSDPVLLNRIIVNLLKNALEASGKGETVTLSCDKTADAAIFRCHNNSVMPRDVQLQVFQRSFSTKGNGRGIGTYSVKLLSEKYLKGKVSFISNSENGTVFTAALPA